MNKECGKSFSRLNMKKIIEMKEAKFDSLLK